MEEDDAEILVGEGKMKALTSSIFIQENEDDAQADGHEQKAIECLLMDESPQRASRSVLIAEYSRINITNNGNFARTWALFHASQLDRIPPILPTGNSRDEPTPFLYRCAKTAGSTYPRAQKLVLSMRRDMCQLSSRRLL